jgi:hypothetical protein
VPSAAALLVVFPVMLAVISFPAFLDVRR